MVKRKRIGLVFSNNENWIGGTYYILNLISAINTIDDSIKPLLVIFYTKNEDIKIIQCTNYPYLEFITLEPKYSLSQRILNKLSTLIFNKKIIEKKHDDIVEIVFPYSFEPSLKKIKNKLCWIPDFQEHFLPNFFSAEEIKQRKEKQQKIVKSQFPVVFSSIDAQNNFNYIYPQAENKTYILNFAVTHNLDFNKLNIDDIYKKYNLNEPYYMSPNQFWVHKNHKIIIEAARILKEQDKLNFKIVFTGKEYDHRYPEYTTFLKTKVKEYNLEEKLIFLGFIDRGEQLMLLKHSMAVIQPSKFEGWSTVIEDAKSLNKYIIASNLEVNKEQVKENVVFFDSDSYEDLAFILENYQKIIPSTIQNNYEDDILKFGMNFNNIISIEK